MSAFTELDFIFNRRSVRVYAPGEVSETQVEGLLRAAMAAPSAMTKDPWRFVVVREPGTLAALAAALPGGKMLATATLGIAVCGDQEAAFERHSAFLVQDCSAAVENLLLAAPALGLGACWAGVYPGEEAIRQVRRTLSLPASFVPIAVVAVGRPGEQLEPRSRYNPDYVRRERWA